MTIPVARTLDELDALRQQLPGQVVVVPTMGALHEGHRSLIRLAKETAESVVVTVFVNPLQFGPAEDLGRYPRTLDADVAMCEEEGVSLVFAPAVEVMYPRPQLVQVCAGPMAERFEGAARPGHFDGVLTVVAKLFHVVRPDVAVFGQKDAQQLALVRRMVGDLALPVRVVAAPVVRDADGLATSSRNRYLGPVERERALALSRALHAAAHAAATGATAAGVVVAARAVFAASDVVPDYVALVDPETFEPLTDARDEALLVVAAKVGTTRLIDNLMLAFPREGGG